MSYDSVQIVRGFYEAAARNDSAAMFANIDPDIVVYEADTLPYGGTHRGIASLQQIYAQFLALWEHLEITLERVMGEGDHVMALVRVSGRLRASGQAFEMPLIEHWTLHDGKAVTIHPFYWDTAALAAAVGAGQGAARAL